MMSLKIAVFTIFGLILMLDTGLCQTGTDYAEEEGLSRMPTAEEALSQIKETEEEALNWAKAVHEKMLARTEEYHEIVDNLLYKLNNLAIQAQKADELDRADAIVMVLIDYNSFLGDLNIMKEILNMAGFIKSQNYMDYFDSMARCYEGLKHDFSLKNELFLSRIDILQDEQALSHEKTLLGLYRDYFLYDFRYDQMIPEVEQEKELER
jgi:hypothetical protein